MWSSRPRRHEISWRAPPSRRTVFVAATAFLFSSTARAQTADTLPASSPPASAEKAPLATQGSPRAAVAPALQAAPPAPLAPRPLVWIGAMIFALPYLASAVAATTGYTANDGTFSSRTTLWIPVVGPFVMMGSKSSAGAEVLLALDGLAQIGGLTTFVCGLASPKAVRAFADGKSRLHVSIAPLFVHGAHGAALVATF